MKFENTFEVDAPIDEVYAALMDVERVAPCVPGAQVLDRKSDDAYEVAIKVKVGPMSMLYKGTVEIVDRQPDEHRAQMRARARESRGQGNADAQVQMALTSENGSTRGTIDTDVKLSGKAAAMGGGVIKEVSGKLVDQFAKNLAAMLGQGSTATQPTPEAAASAGPATPTAPPPTASEPAPEAPSEPTPAAAAAAGPATPTAAQPPAETDALDVGGLIGPMIAGRLRDPKVLGGLGLLIAILLLLRRRS
jgi:carbon monoxide dehydrogenase subunit G